MTHDVYKDFPWSMWSHALMGQLIDHLKSLIIYNYLLKNLKSFLCGVQAKKHFISEGTFNIQ